MTVADTVLINGKVATVDRHFRFTRAIAVKNGWIINVGEDEEIKTHIGPDTQIIDLQGKLILPAAHDAHVHISWLAASWKCVNCSTARTLEALLALLRERAATTPPGQWIHACGFNPAIIDSRRPLTRHDIDSATPNHPAFLALWDGHSCLVNSNALEIVGITRETQDPIGGYIGKTPDGEPDGNFLDIPALQLITQAMPRPTVEELKENIIAAQRFMNREGYASYTEGAMGPGETGAAGVSGIAAYRQLLEEKKLTARVSLAFYAADKGVQSYEILKHTLDASGLPEFPDKNWLDCHSVKIFCDGVPMSHTAWMNQDYADRPGWAGRSVFCGPTASEEEQIQEFHKMALLAHQRGYQLAVHAVGDKAVKVTIDGFINAIQTCPGPQRRHYVLHGSMGDREDFVKAAKYGIILSEQPSPSGSAYDYERRAQVCGIKGEIGKGLKDIIDLGVTVAGGSDGIMDLVNWRQMVQAAVTRKSASSGKIIRPELAISVADGVRMYAINAAYQEFQEQVRGSIEVGKVADFQVLDRDIFSVPHEDIGNSQVLLTMVDGNIVWQCQEQVLQIRKGG